MTAPAADWCCQGSTLMPGCALQRSQSPLPQDPVPKPHAPMAEALPPQGVLEMLGWMLLGVLGSLLSAVWHAGKHAAAKPPAKLPCSALQAHLLQLLGACGEVLLARAQALEEASLRAVRERGAAIFHPSVSAAEPARYTIRSSSSA